MWIPDFKPWSTGLSKELLYPPSQNAGTADMNFNMYSYIGNPFVTETDYQPCKIETKLQMEKISNIKCLFPLCILLYLFQFKNIWLFIDI